MWHFYGKLVNRLPLCFRHPNRIFLSNGKHPRLQLFERWITLRWLPRWRSLLVTSKASSSATTHNIYLILLRKSKAFHRRQIRFEILSATYQKLWGGVPSTPTPLVPRWGYRLGMNLRVRLISLFLASSGAQVQPDIAHPYVINWQLSKQSIRWSVSWPYRGLRYRHIKVECFLKLSAEKLLVFKWSQAQVNCFKCVETKLSLWAVSRTIKILIWNWP